MSKVLVNSVFLRKQIIACMQTNRGSCESYGGAGKMGQSMQVRWRGSTISVKVPGSDTASGPDAIPFLAGCLVHCLIGYVFNKGLYCLLTTTKLPLVG